ncbi:MAG: cold shock and DUF1294 domain-containing protein [Lysobacterales bacterium]
MRGRIVDWKDDRGFGFIEPESGGARIFFHLSETYGSARPSVGTEVMYEISKGPDGRLRATGVAPIGVGPVRRRSEPRELRSRNRVSQPRWLRTVPLLALGVIAGLALLGKIPWWILWVFCGMSLWTFGLYGWDKLAAKDGRWRTPEDTLHACALFGGWPGAMLAQQIFKHKSSKASFQAVFWTTVVVNIVGVVILSWVLGTTHGDWRSLVQ